MARRQLERIEVVCPTCGIIGELYRPRGTPPPRLCACPAPKRVRPSTAPRVCVTCPTVLNRYNLGEQCGACRTAGRTWSPPPAD
jgi:hypothetical protein